jgi:hypothetical protein
MATTEKDVTQKKAWVAELENATKRGTSSGLAWLHGLSEEQQSFYLNLVLSGSSHEGPVSERQRASGLPVLQFPGVGELSQAATNLLREYADAVVAEWGAWDRQIEDDTKAGRLGNLEAMGAQALRDHAAGLTKPL